MYVSGSSILFSYLGWAHQLLRHDCQVSYRLPPGFIKGFIIFRHHIDYLQDSLKLGNHRINSHYHAVHPVHQKGFWSTCWMLFHVWSSSLSSLEGRKFTTHFDPIFLGDDSKQSLFPPEAPILSKEQRYMQPAAFQKIYRVSQNRLIQNKDTCKWLYPRDIITVMRSPCSIINATLCHAVFVIAKYQGIISRSDWDDSAGSGCFAERHAIDISATRPSYLQQEHTLSSTKEYGRFPSRAYRLSFQENQEIVQNFRLTLYEAGSRLYTSSWIEPVKKAALSPIIMAPVFCLNRRNPSTSFRGPPRGCISAEWDYWRQLLVQ